MWNGYMDNGPMSSAFMGPFWKEWATSSAKCQTLHIKQEEELAEQCVQFSNLNKDKLLK